MDLCKHMKIELVDNDMSKKNLTCAVFHTFSNKRTPKRNRGVRLFQKLC